MNPNVLESSPEIETHRNILRQRWELASVLNFFKVFEPVIQSNMKVSAEDVETALIVPNKCLAQLHISLLKGIPPVSKSLKDPDVWVVALSKKLVMWWPWVAEGDFPLTAAKGAEMATYKELDPTTRLVILKALCEIRADQHDVVSYINDAVKNKDELSSFRKICTGEDGKGTSYWLDGNDIIGLRLYKEVKTSKGKGTQAMISSQWETLATNLEEFQTVVEKYSSSKSKLEVAVAAAIESQAVHVLAKIYQKKQRELEKKRNAEKLIDNFCRAGTTRSCRTRKPITYTFDAYDKAITEAIEETKRMKTQNELRIERKQALANEDQEQDQPTNAELAESDSESSKLETEDVSEASADESNGSDEDNKEHMNYISKDGEMKTRGGQRREKKVTVETTESEQEDGTESEQEDGTESEQEDGTESEQEDGESTELDSESSELETNYVSDSEKSGEESDENDDENKQSSDYSSKVKVADKRRESKKITEKDDRSIQQIRKFGTTKRLRQRPNRNTALESAIAPDSEDEMSSEKY